MKAIALMSMAPSHCWRIQLTLEGLPSLTRYCDLLTSVISQSHYMTHKIALLLPSPTSCSRFLAHLCQWSRSPACPLLVQREVPHKALLIASICPCKTTPPALLPCSYHAYKSMLLYTCLSYT